VDFPILYENVKKCSIIILFLHLVVTKYVGKIIRGSRTLFEGVTKLSSYDKKIWSPIH